MTKKDKHSSGPKTGKGKAVSSRNSLTHGLTARRWLDANEQSLFDQTVEAFSAALDLLDKNIPLEKIMLRGGWKSETSAMRYLQSWNDSNWLLIN